LRISVIVTPSSGTDQLSKREKAVLNTFLIVQMFHSVLALRVVRFVALVRRGESVIGESLPVAAIALLLEYALLRGLARGKRWAWGLAIILAIDVIAYASWSWTWEPPGPKVIMIFQLVLLPFGVMILWRKRKHFNATLTDWVTVAGAVLLAIAIVFIWGTYFPSGLIDWEIRPPEYQKLLAESSMDWPQERFLCLLMLL
jgi:hypothetical protein